MIATSQRIERELVGVLDSLHSMRELHSSMTLAPLAPQAEYTNPQERAAVWYVSWSISTGQAATEATVDSTSGTLPEISWAACESLVIRCHLPCNAHCTSFNGQIRPVDD